jgi:protein gp37
MGKDTGIPWCDSTFNAWWGCTEVSPGCDHCYARVLDSRWGDSHWGKGVPRRLMSDSYWAQPLKWDKAAGKAGVKHKVFCASMADVMDDEAPEGQRERLWELIDATPNLIWQLLTKRPQRYERYLPREFKHRNVWFGCSAENQHFYNIRWPYLAAIRIRFMLPVWVSYEPALGPLTIENWKLDEGVPDWIVCGGESGNERRPMQQSWAEFLKMECDERGVAFFMKQMSARTPDEGKALIPTHLLIHEFPEEQA